MSKEFEEMLADLSPAIAAIQSHWDYKQGLPRTACSRCWDEYVQGEDVHNCKETD